MDHDINIAPIVNENDYDVRLFFVGQRWSFKHEIFYHAVHKI